MNKLNAILNQNTTKSRHIVFVWLNVWVIGWMSERFGERQSERLGDRFGKRLIQIFGERLAYKLWVEISRMGLGKDVMDWM